MPLVRPILNKIDHGELLRYAGMKEQEILADALLDEACREALLYARPVGCWEIYGYSGGVILAEKPFTPASNALAKHLTGALRVAVLSVTVGEDIEERVKSLFAEGKYTLALLLDAAATTAVEQAADAVCGLIGYNIGREGLKAGRRFSPGYGDWELSEQPEVLRLAGGEKIGMKLSSAFMLLPRKSITAIMPLCLKENRQEEGNCAVCNKDDCHFRRN